MFWTLFVCFFTVFGCGGRAGRQGGYGTTCLFSALGSSKMEISETNFFDNLITQNDQMFYVKHALAPFYVFFMRIDLTLRM